MVLPSFHQLSSWLRRAEPTSSSTLSSIMCLTTTTTWNGSKMQQDSFIITRLWGIYYIAWYVNIFKKPKIRRNVRLESDWSVAFHQSQDMVVISSQLRHELNRQHWTEWVIAAMQASQSSSQFFSNALTSRWVSQLLSSAAASSLQL